MSKTQVKKKSPSSPAHPQSSTQKRTSSNTSSTVEALELVESGLDMLYKALGSDKVPDPDSPVKTREDHILEWARENMGDSDCLIRVSVRVMGKDEDVFSTNNTITLPALFMEDTVAEAPARLARQFKDQVSFPVLSAVERYLNNLHRNVKPLSEASSDEFMPLELPAGSDDDGPLAVVDV